ncbi:MAG: hypothetical protein MK108_12030 [Mariniblastus sp.]|nr:hypothetical protein [Mariniblastus sp.]
MDSSLRGLILIIDPDPVDWTTHQRLLDCQGYDTCRTRDLSSSSQCALQFPLSMILCQERADRYLGPKLVQRVLQNQPGARPAVMFISKNQSPGVILRDHAFGPAMHLNGSIGPAVFLELVERLLGIPHHMPAPRGNGAIRRGSAVSTTPFFSPFQPVVAPH